MRVFNAEAGAPESGIRFGLSDESFQRWWNSLFNEDAQEYVHLYGGTMLGARFVCALDLLTSTKGHPENVDTILLAYGIARKFTNKEECSHPRVRYEAQALYNDDSVKYLIDAVRYQSRQVAEQRVALLMTRTIERLYDRAAGLPADSKERLKIEQLALMNSGSFLEIQRKERATAAQRRERRAVQARMALNESRVAGALAAPSVEEAKNHLAMLKDALGEEAFTEVVAHAKALSPPPDADIPTI